VAALSFAGLYSIITTIASLAVMGKSSVRAKYFWILAVHDLVSFIPSNQLTAETPKLKSQQTKSLL